MARFLIEVSHDGTPGGCTRDVAVFLKTGSHFFTNADWGCKDGEHKAWILVEVESREEARAPSGPHWRGGRARGAPPSPCTLASAAGRHRCGSAPSGRSADTWGESLPRHRRRG